MIKTVIFDFDGTIAESRYVFLTVFNRLANKYKFKRIELKELEQLRAMTLKERAKYLEFPIHKIPLWAAEFNNTYNQEIERVTLVDGMEEVLDEIIRRGYSIAIISSNSKENIEAFLSRNRIDHVKEIICSSRIFGKDRMIKQYLKKHNLSRSEVIYAGDEARDIVACKKSGIKIIWVGWGYDAAEVAVAEKPDYKVFQPEKILSILP